MRTRGEPSRDGFLVRWLKRIYRPSLQWTLRHRRCVLGLAAAVTAFAIWLGTTFGTSFLPEFNEGTFTIGLFTPPGTSLTASDRIASSIEHQLLQVEGVNGVTRRTGRAERDEHAEPVSNSELEITVLPGYEKAKVLAHITSILEQVPGITANVGQPIQHRLSHILSGTPAAIAISVYGDDLATLRQIAKQIEAELSQLPGTRDVAANREVMIQSLPVRYRPHDLSAYGLTPRAAAEQVRAAVFGVTVAEVHDGVRRYGLAVRLAPTERDEVSDLQRLVLQGAGGAHVRLSEVADIGIELSSNLIARENTQRKAVISLNVDTDANLGHLVQQVQQRVDPIVHQYGYRVHYGGQFEAQQAASQRLVALGGIALLVMLMLLHLAIGSLRVSLLVLINLPLALIGGIAAVFVTESEGVLRNLAGAFGLTSYTAPVLSIASLVGFITLFGIAVRNGILLVNHYRYLQNQEGLSLWDAIIQGSLERLVPILMTALTAALALIPIVFKGQSPGNEILAPLAVVILGGLLSSTFLNLVLVPAGYAALHRRDTVSSTANSSTTFVEHRKE